MSKAIPLVSIDCKVKKNGDKDYRLDLHRLSDGAAIELLLGAVAELSRRSDAFPGATEAVFGEGALADQLRDYMEER